MASQIVSYLIEVLGAERFAYVHAEDYFAPNSIEVDAGLARVPNLPETNFYFWKNVYSGGDLILLSGDAQPDVSHQARMAAEAIGLARRMGVYRIITFAAAPSPIQHRETPGFWGVANSPELRDHLRQAGMRLLKTGQISGLNGLLLGAAARENLPGMCLLGEVPYYTINFENPRTSRTLLQVLTKFLNLPFGAGGFEEAIVRFDQEVAEMGKKAQETMASLMPMDDEDFEEMDEGEEGLAYSDDEEWDEDEPVPGEVIARIEELFKQVERDLALAAHLKAELDHWGIYEEYEDRFLDLFRPGGEPRDN